MTDHIKEKIVENLKQVYDPEISINIYDLGLIYNIDLSELPKASITHTLTSAFCPAADQIVADIKNAAMGVEGVDSCFIETTFDPPFTQDMMSEEARLALGI
jgi:metal-sulfur cluster biosynthetic enzyme